LLKTEEQLTLLKGDLVVKAESLSMREAMVKAAEKVVVNHAKVTVEWTRVAADALKWREKLKT
jgi:hypothetical protein